MTIRARLKRKANKIIKKAEGRNFNHEESEFLHLVNWMVQMQKIFKFYRQRRS